MVILITGLIILSVAFIYSRYKSFKFRRDTVNVIDRLNKDNEFLYSELIKMNDVVIELIDHIEPKTEDERERVIEELRQSIMN